jgi:ABC transporter substrate binding protein (PQQ-dependent alcohol dehydrogenase system)
MCPTKSRNPGRLWAPPGLVPDCWHWAWERHGGSQLNNRFAKLAKRPLTGYDWSARMAVEAIVDAALRTKSTDPRAIATYLVGDQVALDGFKGNRLAFRFWDRQLRQLLLPTTGNWVVERVLPPNERRDEAMRASSASRRGDASIY